MYYIMVGTCVYARCVCAHLARELWLEAIADGFMARIEKRVS